MADPLGDVTTAGLAVWLDDLSRARLADGSLARLIRDGHVVRDLGERGVEVEQALRAITVRDVAGPATLDRTLADTRERNDHP